MIENMNCVPMNFKTAENVYYTYMKSLERTATAVSWHFHKVSIPGFCYKYPWQAWVTILHKTNKNSGYHIKKIFFDAAVTWEWEFRERKESLRQVFQTKVFAKPRGTWAPISIVFRARGKGDKAWGLPKVKSLSTALQKMSTPTKWLMFKKGELGVNPYSSPRG